MSVLDAGCGTGSITAGIAEVVGPRGRVVGLDQDETLLQMARHNHGARSNLSFLKGDLLTLDFEPVFDIVTAARVLQWISEPLTALQRLAGAAKPAGRVVVLDYNHKLNAWHPDPPANFSRFYQSFLAWRDANGWDNETGNRLPVLFEQAGLGAIRFT